MKPQVFYIILCFIALCGGTLHAQLNPDDYHIYITEKAMQVQNDTLYIDLHFRVKEINVATDLLLVLALSLQSGMKETLLPDIVFTGKRKARYDTRNRILDGSRPLYQPYYEDRGTQFGRVYTFDYIVQIPFSPWMSNARLKLTQIHGNCCEVWEYIQILDPDINLEYKVIVYEENKL